MTQVVCDKAAAGILSLALILGVSSARGQGAPTTSPGEILWAGGPNTFATYVCRKVSTHIQTFSDNIQRSYFILSQPTQGGPLSISRLNNVVQYTIGVDEECAISSTTDLVPPPGVQNIAPVYTYYKTTDTWACCKSGPVQYQSIGIGDFVISSKLFQLMQPVTPGSATQNVYIFQTNDDSSSEAIIVQSNIVPPHNTAIPDNFTHNVCSPTRC
jgi:hypothetical protein